MKRIILIASFLFSIVSFAQPGTIDLTFNNTDVGFGNGADGNVFTTSIQSNGKIIVGGDFNTFNGIARRGIARLNADGTLDTSFNPGIGVNGQGVYKISIQSDGKIIIGGEFTSFNGVGRNYIARLNINGTLDTTFNPGIDYAFNNCVNATSIQSDGKIIVGGKFTSFNGLAINRIVRLNIDGTLDNTFNPGIGTGTNSSLVISTISIQSNGKIIIGGKFFSLDGITISNVVRLNTNGSLDATFNPGTNPTDIVYTTSIQSDGKIIIGGNLIFYNGVIKNGITRLNIDGTLDTTFNSGTGIGTLSGQTINSISIQNDGKIIIGGGFTFYNNVSRNGVARLNVDGGLDTNFNPGGDTNTFIRPTSIQTDGKIIIGGNFSSYNGFARRSIARLNTNGTLDTTFNPSIGAGVSINTTSIQSDGKIIIGGDFTSYNDVVRNRIARLNTNGTLDTTFNPGTGPGSFGTPTINKITIQSDGKIIIVGNFTSYNGVSRNRIARLNTDGTLDTTFNPGTGANNIIYSISIQSDGKIIIGGFFTTYNGISRNLIARLNIDGTLDTTFNSGGTGIAITTSLNRFVNTTSIQSDGKIIIGGFFSSYNDIVRNNIARLNTDGTLDATFNPGSLGASRVYITSIQSDGKIIIARVNSSINGITYYGFIRLNTNGTLDSTFNSATGLEDMVSTFSIQTDGKIIIGGWFSLYSSTTRNSFARLNNDGSLDTTFIQGPGTVNSVYTTSIQSDGKIIIGGDFTAYNGTGRNRIARINGNNSLTNSSFDKSNMLIYPNPSNGIFTLITNEMNTAKSISIYTLLGQKIYDVVISSNETTIDVSNQRKGVYIYKVFGERGETKSGKLVIE